MARDCALCELYFTNIKANYKPDSVLNDHLSSPSVAARVKRATFHYGAKCDVVCSCSRQGLPRLSVTGGRIL